MTNVAQLIAYLQSLPQEAIVRARNECGDWRDINLENYCVDLADFREGKNQFVTEGHELFGKIWVDIEGE